MIKDFQLLTIGPFRGQETKVLVTAPPVTAGNVLFAKIAG
jgi:hypothetical protein